jgi:predicted 3-demethylubiquinone-9 3-methyltransferase (glyoxalase superfamily)
MNVRPFLMFQGVVAEQAMKFYLSLFPGSRIVEIARHGKGSPGPEGSVMKATFEIAGQQVHCTDSFVKHDFGLTPAFSLFVECDSEAEVLRLADALGEGGRVLMPAGNYGFSKVFAWVDDRFGVSWQLNCAK